MTTDPVPRSQRLGPALGLMAGFLLLAYGVRPVVVAVTLLPLVGRANQAHFLGQIAIPAIATGLGIFLIVVSLKKLRQRGG